MQNRATLCNALRKRNDESPSVSNAMQSSETLRNSLGLNYESPALTAELQARLQGELCQAKYFCCVFHGAILRSASRSSANRRKRGKKHDIETFFGTSPAAINARAFSSGKEVWKSLKTSYFSVAQAKLGQFLKEHREQFTRLRPADARLKFGPHSWISPRGWETSYCTPRTRPNSDTRGDQSASLISLT